MLNGFAYCKMLFEQNQPQDFIYLVVNSSFEALTGLKNVIGKKVSEVIPGIREFDPELLEIYGKVALTGKPERVEIYVQALKAWFDLSVYSPKKEHFVVLFDVITERKRAERVKNQMQLTETLLETIPSPVFYKDASGRYLGCNRAFEEFWGKRREAVVGKDVYEMGPKEIADKYTEMDQYLLERPGSQMYEWKVMAADGSEKEVIFYKASFLDANGKIAGLIGVILDITDRKQTEKALRESDESRTLVNQIPAVVFKGYQDWSIDFFDQKIGDLTGYSKDEFDSRQIKWCELILPEDLNSAHGEFIKALKNDKCYVREYRIRKKDGSICFVQARGQIFCDAAGKVDYVRGVLFDITEQKQAEETLVIERNKLKFVLETIPNGVYIVSQNYDIEYS